MMRDPDAATAASPSRRLRYVEGQATTAPKASAPATQRALAEESTDVDQRRQTETARQQAARDADPDYHRHRWLALWRSESWEITKIAATEGVPVDQVRAAIDVLLRAYTGRGITEHEQERMASRDRLRASRRPATVATKDTSA